MGTGAARSESGRVVSTQLFSPNSKRKGVSRYFRSGKGETNIKQGKTQQEIRTSEEKNWKTIEKTVTAGHKRLIGPADLFVFFCNFLLLVIFILDFHRGLQNTQLASFSDKTEKQNFCGPEYYLPHLCQHLQLKVKYQFSPVNLFNLVTLILTLLLYYIFNVFWGFLANKGLSNSFVI